MLSTKTPERISQPELLIGDDSAVSSATVNVVVLDADLSAEQAAQVQSLSERIRVTRAGAPEELENAHILYCRPGGIIATPCEAASQARLVQLCTVACDGIGAAPLAERGVPFANVRGVYTPAVAEFAIGLLLSLRHRLDRCHDLQQQGIWTEEVAPLCGDNCYGKTLGIVGYGSIGRHIARIAAALGMKILVCKNSPEERVNGSYHLPSSGDPEGLIPQQWFGLGDVTEMFARCDNVIVTLPATAATLGSIGKRELSALPSHAVLINIGRGGVVDESALADRLRRGELAGAGLDVAATEPLPAGSPLWGAPNLLLTPHIASFTRDQSELAILVLLENLRRDLAGRTPINLISPSAGY